MTTKKNTKANPAKSSKDTFQSKVHTEPVFPYTNKPGSLRKFLQEVPNKPKPAKIDKTLMQSWGFRDTNDMSILRVLKAVRLLNDSNEPTDVYVKFMNIKDGAAALAQPVRDLYAPLFTASHTPYTEPAETLKNLFNIHSGGSPTTLEYQIQTFKAVAESTNFTAQAAPADSALQREAASGQSKASEAGVPGGPQIHIDVHIHLPENKTRRDYEAMIEDIGRVIYGKKAEESIG